MSELFPFESITIKSPRLLWLERYDIHTYKTPGISDDQQPWNAWQGKIEDAIESGRDYYTGKTEDEALVCLCKYLGIKLWNEETNPQG